MGHRASDSGLERTPIIPKIPEEAAERRRALRDVTFLLFKKTISVYISYFSDPDTS